MVAVFSADKDQRVILNHVDGRVSTVNVVSLDVSTMSAEAERPRHVIAQKVLRATLE